MYYIQAPYTPHPIEYHKGKVKRVKRARKEDVPQEYRKRRKRILSEIIWMFKNRISI